MSGNTSFEILRLKTAAHVIVLSPKSDDDEYSVPKAPSVRCCGFDGTTTDGLLPVTLVFTGTLTAARSVTLAWSHAGCPLPVQNAVAAESWCGACFNALQDLPGDWQCPVCGAPKKTFQTKEVTVAGFAQNQKCGSYSYPTACGISSLLLGLLFRHGRSHMQALCCHDWQPVPTLDSSAQVRPRKQQHDGSAAPLIQLLAELHHSCSFCCFVIDATT